MSMNGEEQDQGELRPQLSPLPSSPENTPTSSFRIQVTKVWTGFGFTTSEESETDKENRSMEANRNPMQDSSSLRLYLDETQNVADAPDDIFEEDEEMPQVNRQSSDHVLTSQTGEENKYYGDIPVLGCSPSPQIRYNNGSQPSQSTPVSQPSGLYNTSRQEESVVTPSQSLDDSVILLSPPPVKEPSYVDISDDFQDEELNLELSQTQAIDRDSQTRDSKQGSRDSQQGTRDSQQGTRDSQQETRDSQLSGILIPNSLLTTTQTDIEKMMADDDDLQNMTSIIDLDGTQSSSNDKEDSIDIEIFNIPQRLDFHVPSPMKDYRRQFSSPHKIKTDFPLISPLKLGGANRTGICGSESSNNNSGLGLEKRQKEKEPEPAPGPLESREGEVPDQEDSVEEILQDEVQDAQSLGCDFTETVMKSEDRDIIPSKEGDTLSSAEHDVIKRDDNDDEMLHEDTNDVKDEVQGVLKRKAAEALSSEEESRKKKDLKNTKVPEGESCSDSGLLTPGSTALDSSSRPISRSEYEHPDISCSPIVGVNTGTGSIEYQEQSKKRKTSTPGNKMSSSSSYSSPRKILRMKMKEQASVETLEDEVLQGLNQPRGSPEQPEIKNDKEEETQSIDILVEDSLPLFKSPGFKYENCIIEREDGKEFKLEEVKQLMKDLGYRIYVLPETKKRVSDASSLSRNSSDLSGYLGGSSGVSSGESGKRSRYSLYPEVSIEKHKTISKIPNVRCPKVTVDLEQVSKEYLQSRKAIETSTSSTKGEPSKLKTKEENQKEFVTQKSENLTTIIEDEESSVLTLKNTSRKTYTKASVKGKSSSTVSAKKKLTKKKVRKISEEEELEETSSPESAEPAPTVDINSSSNVSDISVGSMVFGRWTDPAGVYFYAAEVLELLNSTEAKVRFLDDKIERVLKIESELINVKALHPHDEITVKHDNTVYDVSAKLMTFPTLNRAGDVQYEIEITPTDSEPQFNEDSRMVHFSEVSLSDAQASMIIRRMGFVPASNKVSAEINFGNLIYGKRKPRSVNSSPASITSIRAHQGSPSRTPKKKTPRRKRGGSNVEESAAATETSASELTPRGKKTLTYLTQEEQQDNESLSKRSRKSGLANSSVKSNLFKGMTFIITSSKFDIRNPEELPEVQVKSGDFDKSKVRSAIYAGGGRILESFPGPEDLHETLNDVVLTISDSMCVTYTYLISLAHSVPILSYRYILDSVSLGKLVERDIYLLPAGKSTLLLEDVEQFKDYTKDLAMFECLLPSPPATSTRLSNKSKDTETISHKKILSGLNVLIISTNKEFTVDWQSVLVAMGATVHKRFSNSDRLSKIRIPDVVVADSVPPQPIFQDLQKIPDIPIVNTNWVIQCMVNNARVAYGNFVRECKK